MTYEISPVTINNFYKVSEPKPIHYARNDVKIVVIPQSKFDRVKEEIKIETNKVVEEEQQSLL